MTEGREIIKYRDSILKGLPMGQTLSPRTPDFQTPYEKGWILACEKVGGKHQRPLRVREDIQIWIMLLGAFFVASRITGRVRAEKNGSAMIIPMCFVVGGIWMIVAE